MDVELVPGSLQLAAGGIDLCLGGFQFREPGFGCLNLCQAVTDLVLLRVEIRNGCIRFLQSGLCRLFLCFQLCFLRLQVCRCVQGALHLRKGCLQLRKLCFHGLGSRRVSGFHRFDLGL